MQTPPRSKRLGAALAAGLGLATVCAARPQLLEDVTVSKGLGAFIANTGNVHGPGGVFADLNGDEYPDLFLVHAGVSSLYLNVPAGGERTFERPPGDAGAAVFGPATGALAADYDNDGDLDLYVLMFDNPNVLLRNRLSETGTLAYIDVTASTDPTPQTADDQLGLAGGRFEGVLLDNSLTGAWADIDLDGDPDLYVGNHNGKYGHPLEGPHAVPGRRDILYRNEGDGTFTDITMLTGVTGFETATGAHQTANQRFSSTNAVLFADFDNDGWPDLLVTNKLGGPDDREMLYLNRGADAGGAWLGMELATYDLDPPFGHLSAHAMGVDAADVDRDGDLDIHISDWSDPVVLTAPGANDTWFNRLAETGVLSLEHSDQLAAKFSWGVQWQDFDNDGWPDLFLATQDGFGDRLYMNTAPGFIDTSTAAGLGTTWDGRGAMTADFDRDGRIDLFVVHLGGVRSALYRNAFPRNGQHFLTIGLCGDHSSAGRRRSTRDALGARVTVVCDADGDGALAPDERLIREVVSGSSNAASTSSLELEFGLGLASTAQVEIRWPSGRVSRLLAPVDAWLRYDESALVDGDLDGDGDVDRADAHALRVRWGPCPAAPDIAPADLDRDGTVGLPDLAILLANWTG